MVMSVKEREREIWGPAFYLFTSPSMALHVRLPCDSRTARHGGYRLIRPRKGAASLLCNPLPNNSFATHLVARCTRYLRATIFGAITFSAIKLNSWCAVRTSHADFGGFPMLPKSMRASTADHPNASPQSNSSPSLFTASPPLWHTLATADAPTVSRPAGSGGDGGARAGRRRARCQRQGPIVRSDR